MSNLEIRIFEISSALEIAAWCGGQADLMFYDGRINVPTTKGIVAARPGDAIVKTYDKSFAVYQPKIAPAAPNAPPSRPSGGTEP